MGKENHWFAVGESFPAGMGLSYIATLDAESCCGCWQRFLVMTGSSLPSRPGLRVCVSRESHSPSLSPTRRHINQRSPLKATFAGPPARRRPCCHTCIARSLCSAALLNASGIGKLVCNKHWRQPPSTPRPTCSTHTLSLAPIQLPHFTDAVS